MARRAKPKVQVVLRLPPELRDWVGDKADGLEVSMNSLIVRILQEACEKEER